MGKSILKEMYLTDQTHSFFVVFDDRTRKWWKNLESFTMEALDKLVNVARADSAFDVAE
jgi:hypothetical protein